MNRLRRRLSALCASSLLAFCAASSARASDHFLAIGGGDGPSNNQVSLEKNIHFFQRLLVDREGPNAIPDVLFSNGVSGPRDLQFEPPEEPPRLNLLLSRLFGREYDFNFHYRRHDISGLRGPSTREGLDAWFNSTGKTLGEGDRLIIYFTGHGGSGKPAENTTMSMWCQRPMHVNEFVGLLDRLSPKVQVVLVMVQCHSGGFAGTIFKDGKAGGDLSPARRCGYFATTYDRNAAGCTPDTAEDDYKDYSTYFFAALDGKTRTGKPVSGCDLDGDGRVSFAEAHAYTVVHSDTIDIPTTTSEALLRQFSKTAGDGLAKAKSPFGSLMEQATPLQKYVLQELSQQLKLSGDDRYAEAKHLAEIVEAERKSAERNRQQKNDEADRLAQRIRSRIVQRWPELSNPWNPQVPELMAHEGKAIQEAIEKDADAAQWQRLHDECDKLDDRELDAQRRWVKCQRLVRMLETTALAANLEKVAKPPIVERYKQMLEDEAGSLSPSATAGGN